MLDGDATPQQAAASVWLLDTAGLDAALIAAWLPRLGTSELQRFHGFKRRERSMQFLAGRILLRRVVEAVAGVAPQALQVVERPGNAPVVRVAGPLPLPHFSLSHSGRWIACAASAETPVGVDIEILNTGRDINSLAAHAFGEDEAAAIAKLSGADRYAAFYALWSRREAEFKLAATPAFYYPLPHPELAVALCTAHPVQSSRLHTYCMRVQDC